MDFVKGITQRIALLPIPKDVLNKYILSEKDRQQDLFALMTIAFAKKFPSVQKDELLDLSTAIYLGARAVYIMDPVLDLQLQGNSISACIREGHFLYNESLRILNKLFPYKHEFWPVYYKLLNDHYDELNLSKQVNIELNDDAYHQLLMKKYALLFMPLETLHHLSERRYKANYDKLSEFLHTFITGYNIPNEIRGLSDDITLQINNYTYWQLKAILPQYELNITELNAQDMHKVLYASGMASRLYTEALAKLSVANDIALSEGLKDLSKLVTIRMQENKLELEQVEQQLSEINERVS